MRIPVLVAVVLVVLASACGESNSGSANRTADGAMSDAAPKAQDALVYAAVIRQLVAHDHGFGSAPSPYRHVYVLDGIVSTAADPMHLVEQPAKPFSDGLSRQIAAELEDLPPVSFVASRGLVITGSGPGQVVHRGVLVTVGRIVWIDRRTAKVANNRWASGLNGQWLTYILKLDHSSWRIAGVSGNKVAIS